MAALKRTDVNAPIPDEEVFGPVCEYGDLYSPMISYGLPFDKAIVRHIKPDAKVFVLASKSLCANTDSLERLKAAVGSRFTGARIGMAQHTHFQECLEVIAAVKAAQADTVVTLGGGSLADAAKLVCCALSNDISSVDHLTRHQTRFEQDRGVVVDNPPRPSDATLIMIPTTLSAGEHTPFSGVTDADTGRKYQVYTQAADVTILDPWLCLHTPNSVWLQSGVRGIDHAIEMSCAIKEGGARPESVELTHRALGLLVPALLLSAREAGENGPPYHDERARLSAQLAVSMAVVPLMWGVSIGASHGIGHMMGPMGVGHGQTSCVMLPAVCAYNRVANAAEQAATAAVLWAQPECARLFAEQGLRREDAELSDLLDAVIRALGMPRTLREVGIVGEDKLRKLAEMSMNDICVKMNPRPIHDADDVMKILKMVEG